MYTPTHDYNYTFPSDGSVLYFNFCNFCLHECNGTSAYAIYQTKKPANPALRFLEAVLDNQQASSETPGTRAQLPAPQGAPWSPVLADKARLAEQSTPAAVDAQTETHNCIRLTSQQKYSDFEYSPINSKQLSAGIVLLLVGGSNYVVNGEADSGINYQIQFRIECNINEVNPFIIKNVSVVNNTFYVTGHSRSGCPTLLLSALWDEMATQKVLMSLIFLSTGVLYCFFGNKVRRLIYFLDGLLAGFGILLAVLAEFVLKPQTDKQTVQVLIVISLAFGVLLGYTSTRTKLIGKLFLGIWTGIIVAVLLNQILLYKIASQATIWVSVILISLAFGLIGFYLKNTITIFSTSLMGGYLLIRPLGWLVGDYPNEFSLVKEIKYGLITSVPKVMYLYFLLICITAIVGIQFQLKHVKSSRKNGGEQLDDGEQGEGEEEEEDDNDYVEMSVLEQQIANDESIDLEDFQKKKKKKAEKKSGASSNEDGEGDAQEENENKYTSGIKNFFKKFSSNKADASKKGQKKQSSSSS